MNVRSSWLKTRSNSAPLSSEHMRIRRCDFERLVDRAVQLRMKAKKAAIKRQKTPGPCTPSAPACLMPRLGIVDDKSHNRILAQLEVPDVSNDSMQLELHDDRLTVSGTRQPQLVSVPTEHEATFVLHSQTVIGGDQRPRLIMLAGDKVASIAAPCTPPIRQSQAAQNAAPQQSSPVSLVFYNELRYGPFRRDLRVPLGTKVEDIHAALQNGMLLLSWPRVPTTATTLAPRTHTESKTVTVPVAPDVHATALNVKVESVEE